MQRITRRKAMVSALAAGAGSLLSSCGSGPENPAGANIEEFFTSFSDEWVAGDPDLATYYRYFAGANDALQDELERQLTPVTPSWRRQRVVQARNGLSRLQNFDRSSLTATQQQAADVMEWSLGVMIRGEEFDDYDFPLNQMTGVNVGLVEMFTVARALNSERDAENYLAALGQVGSTMGDATAQARRLAGMEIIPPDFIIDATVAQMSSLIANEPGQNPFVTVLPQKLAGVEGLTPERMEEIRAEAEEIVRSQVYPAYQEAVDALTEQRAIATSDAGLWRLDGGDAAYAHFLNRYTTTDLTADEVHQIGLEQVERIEAQMDTLLAGLGRTEGSVNDRVEQLRIDLRYPNPTSAASRAQIMEDLESYLRDAEERAASMFDNRPMAPVVVQPHPDFRENNAAANYNLPAPDGSRPGTIQYPRRVERMTKFGLRTLIYHEGVPGHHFHLALAQENTELPRFVQLRLFGGISASTEGWALYAERLAAESGWYEDDPEGELGQLSDELWRARRLVVDTGLHSKQWTRQQSIDYGIEASEVERYVVYPGQACSYMIGQRKILELRDRAQAALGDAFSIRQFHNVVLGSGTVPLMVLERNVDTYIASTSGIV